MSSPGRGVDPAWTCGPAWDWPQVNSVHGTARVGILAVTVTKPKLPVITDSMRTREMSEEQQDLAALDDPEFLAERRRVREELERIPLPGSADLAARFAALDEEFIRRARAAWAPASRGSDQ
jgi:hypothetical protein